MILPPEEPLRGAKNIENEIFIGAIQRLSAFSFWPEETVTAPLAHKILGQKILQPVSSGKVGAFC